jgi:hypothetical protein
LAKLSYPRRPLDKSITIKLWDYIHNPADTVFGALGHPHPARHFRAAGADRFDALEELLNRMDQ